MLLDLNFGRVFAVDYNGITCAAKNNYFQLCYISPAKAAEFKRLYLKECLQYSILHHPNIVKLLGLYYPPNDQIGYLLVMKLIHCNLTELLLNYQDIPMYVKLVILQDVAKAACYLHTQTPAISHCRLNARSVLLTTCLVAKLTNPTVFPVVSSLVADIEPVAKRQGYDFMPPKVFEGDPNYGLSLDVLSFGCVVCHVVTQERPTPLPLSVVEPKSGKMITVSEVERRRQWIDQISEESLKQLVVACLDNDQARRPSMSLVSERITSLITG